MQIALHKADRKTPPPLGMLAMIPLVLISIVGCNMLTDRPELSPDKFAPPSAQHEWEPLPAVARQYDVSQSSTTQATAQAMANESGRPYDLAGLIDVALRNNPRTRRAWEAACGAAASYGASRSPY